MWVLIIKLSLAWWKEKEQMHRKFEKILNLLWKSTIKEKTSRYVALYAQCCILLCCCGVFSHYYQALVCLLTFCNWNFGFAWNLNPYTTLQADPVPSTSHDYVTLWPSQKYEDSSHSHWQQYGLSFLYWWATHRQQESITVEGKIFNLRVLHCLWVDILFSSHQLLLLS